MKKIISILVVLVVAVGFLQAQEYSRVKVNMANGLQLRGSNARIESDTLIVHHSGMTSKINLSEVKSMLAKNGKGETYAIGCGASCLGYSVVNLIAIGGEDGLRDRDYTLPKYVASFVFFTGLSVATGYLIGSLLDPYEVVYIKESSLLNRVHVNVSTDPLAIQPIPGGRMKSLSLGTPMLNVSYRF